MIKIIFIDMYGGMASVLIKFAEDSGTMFQTIQDFMDISTDLISDESAYLVARRFYTYAKRIGYPVELNSPDPAVTTFKVDLPSGNVMPSRELGEEVHLPEVPRETPVAMEEPSLEEYADVESVEHPVSSVEEIKVGSGEDLTFEEQETLKRMGGI